MIGTSRLALLFAAAVSCAFAQLNSAELRTRFGPPIDRETFHVPQGFDMVVDYGPGMTVCKIEVPSLMPTDAKVQNSVEMSRHMYEFLASLIPQSIRGREMGVRVTGAGLNALFKSDYEKMTITELRRIGEAFGTTTITVHFKDPNCDLH